MAGFFISGTDTGVGKTRVSCLLMQQLIDQGEQVIGLKPIASGCADTDEGLRNDDAVALMQTSNVQIPYPLINRYAFSPAIAPHIAAELTGVSICLETIYQDYSWIETRADTVIVEGVGGWLVPLGQGNTMSSLAIKLRLPVILVVAIRLGCLNHALLTAQAIEQSGLEFFGWIANQVSNEGLFIDQQVESLEQALNAPLLCNIPFSQNKCLKPDRKIEL